MFQLVDLIVVLRIQFWLFQTLIICPVDEMEFSRQCTCTPLRINENLVSCRYTLRAPGVHRIWSVHHVFMLQTLLYHLFRVHAKYTNCIIGHNKTHILVHQAYTAGCYVMCAKHNSIHTSVRIHNRSLCTQRLVYQAYRPRTMDTRLLNYSCLHVKSCANPWTHFYDLFKH